MSSYSSFSNFNFRSHTCLICSSYIYRIRDLRRSRRYLDVDSAKLLTTGLLYCRLDYCNSILSGIAGADLAKLQRILNRLAHVVTWSLPFARSVPLLGSLSWLLVNYRVNFRICLMTYKALHEEHPVHLHSMLATSLPSRSLSSNKGITLSVPRIKTNAGARAFRSCPLLFGTAFHYLSVQTPQLLPSGDVSKRIFFFCLAYRRARQPAAVAE